MVALSLRALDLAGAFLKVKEATPKRNFTQSVELIIKLRDINLKSPEGRISKTVELPNPPNKAVKVCAIGGGDFALRARAAGADLAMSKEDLERLAGDKKAAKKLAEEYDFFIAEAPLMPLVGKILGPVLGPRGKMPTPIPPNAPLEEALAKHRRMVRIRVKDQPLVQCRIGTEDMDPKRIEENAKAVLGALEESLQKGAKNIESVRLKLTMGPSMKVA
ncbi:MAG: 50S ribosomal protein L1 [Candidatus Bathyarchaeia archaeon]